MYSKYTILFVLLCTFPFTSLSAQNCETPAPPTPFSANNLLTFLQASGTMHDAELDLGLGVYGLDGIVVPQKTAFAMGLWMGALDTAGNLQLAASEFGPNNDRYDYYPGPLNYGDPANPLADPARGTVTNTVCSDWNQVWVVSRSEIEAFRADFMDDGLLQANHPAVFAWPGSGNAQFAQYNGFELPAERTQGLAPFWDGDADGVYEPAAGEYPNVPQSAILPEVIAWSIFNDAGNFHNESNSSPLQMEVRQTSWGYNCTAHPWLNEAIFTSYVMTNVGVESLDSLYLGFWTDFDLGCFDDDYVGTAPELSAFYTYNGDAVDGSDGQCSQGTVLYEGTLPAQAVTFLNEDLDRTFAISRGSAFLDDPGRGTDFYRYLSGVFRDGTPITRAGIGYNPDTSLVAENFVFSDNPNDADGWSMFAGQLPPADLRAVGSHYEASLAPSASVTLDLAFSVHQDPDSSHVQVVNLLYEEVEELREMYGNRFEDACEQIAVCEADCVYPGDANADGIANHYDLLNLRYDEGQTGPRRRPSLAWLPINAEDWPGSLQTGAPNQKHADCNASGEIEFTDFEITRLHYDRTRPDYVAVPDTYPDGEDIEFLQGGLATVIENLGPGGRPQIIFGLRLNEARSDVKALAFVLEYDTAFVQIDAGNDDYYFEDTDEGLVYYQNERPGEIDLAVLVSPATSENVIGQIQSGLFRLRLKENADQGIPGDTTCLRIKNVVAYDADGSLTEVAAYTVKVTFSDQVVVRNEEPLVESGRFQAFPNPTADQLQVKWQDVVVTDYTILDVTGQRMQQGKGHWTERMELDVASLPAGIYFLQLATADGTKGETLRFVKL